MITATRLREVVHYDPATGAMTWLHTKGRKRKGSQIGNKRSQGYLARAA